MELSKPLMLGSLRNVVFLLTRVRRSRSVVALVLTIEELFEVDLDRVPEPSNKVSSLFSWALLERSFVRSVIEQRVAFREPSDQFRDGAPWGRPAVFSVSHGSSLVRRGERGHKV